MQLQFDLVDATTHIFEGHEILSMGDLGVASDYNQPLTTHKVERVLARFFGSQAAMLVRGAGTMAIRLALHACLKPGDTILVHQAPVYPTTLTSLQMLGIQSIAVDFHDNHALSQIAASAQVQAVLIQVTRQQPSDSYDLKEVIACIRAANATLPIISDDNYAALKTAHLGCQVGASLACFSSFKLQGPEGVGCIIGEAGYIDSIKKGNYSGGLQVQGHEALAALRGMIHAPVSLAIASRVVEELAVYLKETKLAGVADCFIANAQSKVLIVQLEQPIAALVLREAAKLGAAPHPVGAESKYEVVPMFYRVSSTFLSSNPQLASSMIRINPMRAGCRTILRILKQAISAALNDTP
jgi:Cys/Met metabolism PLP-dependent enzyme